MAKLIRCECGYIARGETTDEVIGELEQHMSQDHPDLAGKVSLEDMLSWIEEA